MTAELAPVPVMDGQLVMPGEGGTAVFTGEVHPLAAVWPMLDDDELESLGESIAEIGLREPIALDSAGRLLDGRNRLDRCLAVGVEPRFVTVAIDTDAEAAAFIQAANAERRHLKPGQLAMGRALMLQAQGKRQKGRWAYGIHAESAGSGVSGQRMREAGAVLDWVPGLAVDVLAGTIALDDAHTRAKVAEDEATAVERAAALAAARLADLRDHRPDLAALVDAGNLSLDDALTVRDKELSAARKVESDRREAVRKFNTDVRFSIHCLAPLATYELRREQVARDLEPNGPTPVLSISDDDCLQAIASIELIRATLKEKQ